MGQHLQRDGVDWKCAKGIPTKGIGKRTESSEFQVFTGCLQGVFLESFRVFFKVFFPMPFLGMPFAPFQVEGFRQF